MFSLHAVLKWFGKGHPTARKRPRRRTRRPLVEELEPRILLANDLYLVPGAPRQQVAIHSRLTARRTLLRNEVGLFVVDDAFGRIGTLLPGDAGYAVAALGRAQVLHARGAGAGSQIQVTLEAGQYVATYLVQNSTSAAVLARNPRNRLGRGPVVFFSLDAANPDHIDHVRGTSLGGGSLSFAWEDLTRGGDRDFNDAVFTLGTDQPVAAPVAPVNATAAVVAALSVDARLARDTAPGGATNNDRITFDPAITGKVTGNVRELRAGFDNTPAANFFDVFADLQSGVFNFDRPRLEQINRGVLADGLHTLHLQARDAMGNQAMTDLAFTLDTAAATGTIRTPAAGSITNQNLAFAGHLADALSGVSSAEVQIDSGAVMPVIPDAAGDFSVPLNLALNGSADGQHTARVRATDVAGNVSAFSAVTFTLDTQAPAVTIESLAAGVLTNRNVTVAGHVTDNVSGVASLEAQVDNGGFFNVVFDAAGSYSFPTGLNLDGSADGSHKVRLRATDRAGNVSGFTEVMFTLDSQAPRVTIDQPPDGLLTKTNVTVAGQVMDALSGVASLRGQIDGASPFDVPFDAGGNYSFDTTLPLDGSADGNHTVHLRATDRAGNISSFFDVFFTLDTKPPVVTISSPAAGQTVGGNVHVAGQVTDAVSGVASLKAQVDNGTFFDVPFDANGAWGFDTSLPLDGSAEGDHRVRLQATDRAGNVSGFSDVTFTLTTQSVLREGTAFTVAAEQTITIPAEPSLLTFTWSDPVFDTTDPDSINDAFEVALVDAADNPLVHPIRTSRDAFFNITEDQQPVAGAGTTRNNHTVSVNLAGIVPGTAARLVFRLVNNDSDVNTSVLVPTASIVPNPGGQPTAATPATNQAASIQTLDFGLLEEVSSSVMAEYGETSFNADTRVLHAAIALHNAGIYSVSGPILVGVTHLSDPTVMVRDADGMTPNGVPYYDFSAAIVGGTLQSGAVSAARELAFFNPNRAQFTYDLMVLGQLNRGPIITTEPNVEALLGKEYVYDADAVDADSDALSFSLMSGPSGLTVDAATGRLTWMPTAADKGTHTVALRVEDGRGGSVEQRYVLEAMDAPPNRPPLFTSTPGVDANVGATYTYQAAAKDADGDALTFSLVSGPAGLTVDAAGLVAWTPTAEQLGVRDVTLQVSDGHGGTAMQSYAILVQQAAGNHAPMIVSDPITQVLFGRPYTYDVNALDADNDRLTYSLTDAPSGMTINAVTGLIACNPSNLATAVSYPVAVRVEDSRGGVATQEFTLQVTPVGTGEIRGTKFNDLNGNGVRDATAAPAQTVLLGPTPYLSRADSPLDQSGLGTTFFLEDFEDGSFDTPGVTSVPAPGGSVGVYGPRGLPSSLVDSVDGDDGTIDGSGSAGHSYFTSAGAAGFRFNFDAAVLGGLPTRAGIVWTDGEGTITFEAFDAHGVSLGTVTGSHADNSFSGTTAEDRFYGVTYTGGISAIAIRNSAGGLEVDHLQYGGFVTASGALIVPGNADPWLAGMLTGSLASGGDVAPNQSPVLLTGTPVTPGTVLTLTASGSVSHGFFFPFAPPDGNVGDITPHAAGAENGLSNVVAPVDSLVAVFLGADRPDLTPAPATLDFSTAASRDYLTLSPALKQVFFVGDGRTSTGAIQQIVVPSGATRLFLGTMDGTQWSNNTGRFRVQATALEPGLADWVLYLDQNRNGRRDAVEAVTTTDANGNYAFTGLLPGTCVVAEQQQAGWEQTAPTSGTHEVTLPGTRTTVVNFDGLPPGTQPSSVLASTGVTFTTGDASDSVAVGGTVTLANLVDGFEVLQAPSAAVSPPSLILARSQGTHDILMTFANPVTSVRLATDIALESSAEIVRLLALRPTGQSNEFTVLAFSEKLDNAVSAPDNLLAVDLGGATFTHALFQVTTELEGFDDLTFTESTAVVTGVDFGNHRRSSGENRSPVFTSTPPAAAVVGQPLRYNAAATDPDGDPLRYDLVVKPAGMAVDPATGVVVWMPAADQVGPADVILRVQDGHGGVALQPFQIAVRLTNAAPVITSRPPSPALVGQQYSYQVRAQDAENEAITFRLDTPPVGMTIGSTSGLLTWVPSAAQAGTQRVTVVARDASGTETRQTFDLPVVQTAANEPPDIISHPANRVGLGGTYFYQVIGTDANNDPLTYSLDTAPAGLTISATGLVTWTPTDDQFGLPYRVAVRVEDGRGGFAVQSFTIRPEIQGANLSPSITSMPPAMATVDLPYRYDVRATDPDRDVLRYSLDRAPAGMSIDAATGVLRWTPSAGQTGLMDITVRVEDGQSGFALQSFTVAVGPAGSQGRNEPPRIASAPPANAVVGREYRYDVDAFDPDGDAIVYVLDTAPRGMSIDPLRGTLRWTPAADQIGMQDVAVQVIDARGAGVMQSFSVRVRGVNLFPTIFTVPPTVAGVGQEYTYAVGASDPDGDPQSIALTTAPAGMTIDPATGLIQWTPAAGQTGPQSVTVRVEDGLGGFGTQTWTIVVSATPINHIPAITSTPFQVATVNELYQYQVTAADADGDALIFSLPVSQPGMGIDPATGLVTWTPSAGQLGNNLISVAATDPAGNVGTQTFTLVVKPVNRLPVITSSPVTAGVPGAQYRYDVRATDPDGDRLGFQLTTAPAGMMIDANGRITWSPVVADLGAHPVVVSVTDGRGAPVMQSFDVTVGPDLVAPRVNLMLGTNPAEVGSREFFAVQATDNVDVQGITLTVGGTPVPLDGAGHAMLQLTTAGQFEVVATARDAAGNTGTAMTALIVIDPTDTEAPVIDLTTPARDAVITAPTDVIGTVTDDNLLFYTLEVGRMDGSFTEFARGTTPVTNGVLGRFDPTMLQNDAYILRLTATDANGSTSILERDISVAGDLKLGNFTLAFVDVTVPVSGIPVNVTRTYDTLQSNTSGDFGFGWGLAFRDVNLRTSVAATGLESIGLVNPFRDNSRVYVTLPGGKRQGFLFQPKLNRATEFLISKGLTEDNYLFDPAFIPGAGNLNTLTLTGAPLIERDRNTGEYFRVGLGRSPFNPADGLFSAIYTLTTPEGVAYTIDPRTGDLLSVTETNGNTLTFTDAGVSSSAGPSVTFQRDAAGRIVAVTDPKGQQVRYQYDAAGDLVGVTDREANTTRFTYNPARAHYLDQVIDPLGRTATRTEYGADGRLSQLAGAAGNAVRLVYDPGNSIETMIDGRGNPTAYEYDARGNVVTVVDALGGVTRNVYDADSNLLSTTDALGNRTSFTYEPGGEILTVTGPLGEVTRYTYTTITPQRGRSFTRRRTTTDPLGNTVTSNFDNRGNVISATDATGAVVGTNTFDDKGNLMAATDAMGNTTRFEYDAVGHALASTDPTGRAVRFTYDANGNQTTQATTRHDDLGNLVTMSQALAFDGNNRLVHHDDVSGNPFQAEYDALGHTTALMDRNGNPVAYEYDALGNRNRTVFPDGTEQHSEHDANGNRVSFTDRLGRTTHYEYDALNRHTRTIYPDGTTTLRQYDALGRLTAFTDENGHTTSYGYDAAGRQTRLTDSMGDTRLIGYDAAGRPVSTTDPDGYSTNLTYDANGRVVRQTFADGTTHSFTFDVRGQKTTETDGAGHTWQFEYDILGRLTRVLDALGNPTTYGYDDIGNRISQTDANGNTTRWVYDSAGRVIRHTLPLGMSETFAYNANGNLVASTDFNGRTTAYRYDVNRLLSGKTYPDGSEESFTYTATGRLASVEDALGRTTYQYDLRDRLVRVVQPDGTTLTYTYDAAGNETSLMTPFGITSYSYDEHDRLEMVIGPDQLQTHYIYDPAGDLLRTELPDGTMETRTYDVLHRLTFLQTSGPGGVLDSFRYTLDASGNRTAVEEQDGRRVDYGYDGLSRLVSETITDPSAGNRTTRYTYDAVGNRLTRDDSTEGRTVYAYDVNDRLVTTTLGGVETRYSYDVSGNTLSRVAGPADQAFYQWDTRNRLVAADVTDAGGTHHATYRYDAAGLRVGQTVDGVETRFLLDKARPNALVIAEYAPGGALLASYVYGRRLVSQTRGGQTFFYHPDGLGSTRLVTGPGAAVLARYAYDAFGRLLRSTGIADNAFLFTGEQFDPLLGQYYLRARYYDPAAGRFLNKDFIEGNLADPQSQHKYAYALNNPVNRTDPAGLASLIEISEAILFGFILGAIASGAVEAYLITTLLGALPRDPTAFDVSRADAGLVGVSVGLSPTGILRKTGATNNPIGAFFAALLYFTTAIGGVDVVIPFTGLDSCFIYGYIGAGVGFNLEPAQIEGTAVASVSGYVGLVYNFNKPGDYAGAFVAVSGASAKFAGKVPGNATVFSSPDKGGTYGFNVGTGLNTQNQGSGGLSAAYTYGFLTDEVSNDRPRENFTLAGLEAALRELGQLGGEFFDSFPTTPPPCKPCL